MTDQVVAAARQLSDHQDNELADARTPLQRRAVRLANCAMVNSRKCSVNTVSTDRRRAAGQESANTSDMVIELDSQIKMVANDLTDHL